MTVSAENPFLGLSAYTEELAPYFHGRSDEIEQLYRLLRRGPLTILFGRSGLGKTSLLQAGLSPLLREDRFLPIHIRLLFSHRHEDLVAQVKHAVLQAVADHAVDAPPPQEDETLWEYFHRARFWDQRNNLLTPILVMDQFEELFTLGRSGKRADALIAELEDLVENRIPEAVRRRVDEGGEEPTFSYSKQPYKVLLSLREEFLPQLEDLAGRIPSIMDHRMRLTPMNGNQAFDAVSQSAGELVDSHSARRIVRFVAAATEEEAKEQAAPAASLRSLEVEPALLSLVCFELNNKRIANRLPKISTDLLAGAKTQILADFYERCVEGYSPSVRQFVEDRLLTGSGYRSTVALDDARRCPGVSDNVVEHLVQSRLLRIETHLGIPHLELTHDVLTGVVASCRDNRWSVALQRAAQESQRRLIRRVLLVGGIPLIFAVVAGYMWWRTDRALSQASDAHVARLFEAEIKYAPVVIEDLELFRKQAVPRLEEICSDTTSDPDRKLRAHLALLGQATEKEGHLVFLLSRLLASKSTQECLVIRDALKPYIENVAPLWETLETGGLDSLSGLHAAMALAVYDPPDAEDGNPRWRKNSALVANRMIDAHVVHRQPLAEIIEALRPIAGELIDPLQVLFRSPNKDVRRLAARILGPYASDRPEVLGASMLVADAHQFEVLLPLLRPHSEKVIEFMTTELNQTNHTQQLPDSHLVASIESADGLITARMALCQTMAFEDFLRVAEELRFWGYRPVRCRPYLYQDGIHISAVWRRDYHAWTMSHGLSAEDVRVLDSARERNGFEAVDVAGYLNNETDGLPQYLAIWTASERTSSALDDTGSFTVQAHAGVREEDYPSFAQASFALGLEPHTIQAFLDRDGAATYTSIWRSEADAVDNSYVYRDLIEADLKKELEGNDPAAHDASVVVVPRIEPGSYWLKRSESARTRLDENRDDIGAARRLAQADVYLGRYDQVIAQVTDTIERDSQPEPRLYYWRCVSLARTERFGEAKADAEAYALHAEESTSAASDCAYLDAIIAVFSGNWKVLRDLEDQWQPADNKGAFYNAACWHSLAAEYGKEADRDYHVRQGLELLRKA